MRGASKSLPKYRKHKATGQAIVNLSGKDHYLGPHGTKTSNLEYDRLIAEWLANGRKLITKPNDVIDVSDLIAAYWVFCKTYYVKNGKPTDELASVKIAMRDTRKHYGNALVTEFGPLALEAVRELMMARDCSRGYINNQTDRIRRMFRWGVAKQKVPVAIYQALKAVDSLKQGKCKAKETDRILPVENAIVDITLEHCTPIVADMIQFQRLTGCRPGEVRNQNAPDDVPKTQDSIRRSAQLLKDYEDANLQKPSRT